jgi:hypothetical protein
MDSKMDQETERVLKRFLGYNCLTLTEHLPCHTSRLTVTDSIKTLSGIRKFIDLARQLDNKGLVMFSVTERDIYHKKWLKVAAENSDAQIVETVSRWHGDYKCWMIFFQSKEE